MQETQETKVPSLNREDPLEEGMATYSSIPAWETPWTTVHRVPDSQSRLCDWACMRVHTHTLHLRRTSVLLGSKMWAFWTESYHFPSHLNLTSIYLWSSPLSAWQFFSPFKIKPWTFSKIKIFRSFTYFKKVEENKCCKKKFFFNT